MNSSLLSIGFVFGIALCARAAQVRESSEERVPADGRQTIPAIIELLTSTLEGQYKDKTLFLRDTRPKANPCLKAKFIVGPKHPPELAIDVFKKPHTYHQALARGSSAATRSPPTIVFPAGV